MNIKELLFFLIYQTAQNYKIILIVVEATFRESVHTLL